MRADRLLSIMMLLQSRGRMTARQLAEELEVSTRTIYRDIDALSGAGIPVYGDRGPEGGYALLDSYRTHLTGLTADEVRALFMLTIPAPLVELGVDDDVRAALRKLAAALPDARRGAEAAARQRIHIDAVWWSQGQEPVPHLRTLHEAVWQDRVVDVRLRQPFGAPAVIERPVEPYGLVAKAGVWHLVCGRSGRVRVYRVSSLVDVRLTGASFARPPGFDLAAFWRAWCAAEERRRAEFQVTVRVAPELVAWLSHTFGVGAAAAPDGEGGVTLQLGFESLAAARERLLGLGRAVEVLEPDALRLSVVDFARQIVDLYAAKEGNPGRGA
ncbi:MAG: WYL domain-containing protein [Anaerolineae bacterium]|nr:WYL domain-containing protein [Anaerolineae bacterium]